MATFTITTAVNIDSLASKVEADTYTINGGYLTVDQDTRYGQNNNTSGVMGQVPLSATNGGTVEFNSTLVRIIPYNSGTGNVPAYNTTISRGSASGLLIGVYASLTVAPTTPGSAMPASGFIKIKQWNSVAYTAGALTGISATATAADRAGWLEIVVSQTSGVFTINRLNTFKAYGDFFDLGTTTGNNSGTYQIPTNGSAQYIAGVQVETGVGTGVYEWYPNAGSQTALLANVGTEAVRGKVCWISTSGVVTFQNDGTNSTGGYLPVSGCNVRIPNLIFQQSASGAPTINVIPHTTPSTRPRMTTSGGGTVIMDKACFTYNCNFVEPYSVNLTDTCASELIYVNECGSAVVWDMVCIGSHSNYNPSIGLDFINCQAGGTVTNSVFSKNAHATSSLNNAWIRGCRDFSFENTTFRSCSNRGHATNFSILMTDCVNIEFDSCTLIGNGLSTSNGCDNITFLDMTAVDCVAGTTPSTFPQSLFTIDSYSTNILVDGLSLGGIPMVSAYTGLVQLGASGCYNVKFRNLGTISDPLELGGPGAENVSWTRSSTTATVTHNDHGLKVGDSLVVYTCDSVAAIVLTTRKSVASVPTANTFTFTCLNAGATSGTLSYYSCSTGMLVTGSSTTGANNKFQRIYLTHNRSTVVSTSNNPSNFLFESIRSDPFYTTGTDRLDIEARQTTFKGFTQAPSLNAETNIYGTHMIDYFSYDLTSNPTGNSWARSSTTMTVTSNDHNLRYGTAGLPIFVTASSDLAALPLGLRNTIPLTTNTFSMVVPNAGGTSGTMSFVDTSSRITWFMNEPTVATANAVTVETGNAYFTGAGTIAQGKDAIDVVVYEFPHYVIGHTGFLPVSPVMTGGNIISHDLYYSIDLNDGNGWSSYKNLSYPRAGGSGSSGASTFTVTDATGVNVGDYVFGTGIATFAKVTDVTGNTITVDNANIATVSGTIQFGNLANETSIDPELGFKLKFRIASPAFAGQPIKDVTFYTTSTNTSRGYQYPLDMAELTITGMVSGSDIVILEPGTSTEYLNVDANSGSSYVWQFDAGEIPVVDIGVFKTGYVPFYIRGLPLDASGSSALVVQIPDRNYT